MQTIKHIFMFLFIILSSMIGLNLLFRAGAFLFEQSFWLGDDTCAVSLFLGGVIGLVSAIYNLDTSTTD